MKGRKWSNKMKQKFSLLKKGCKGRKGIEHSMYRKVRVSERVGLHIYSQLHAQVRKIKGKASTYPCVDCGRKASDWSSETEEYKTIKEFKPRCRSCHIKYDYKLTKKRKQMFIIVEGCDCVGKTTLVAHLSKILGWEIKKFSQPKNSAYEEYLSFFLTRGTPVILDRGYCGEEVYGPLWRGKSDLEGLRFKNIEDIIAVHPSVFIYCETSKTEIKKRLIERGDAFTKVSEIDSIVDGFHKALKKSRFDWYRFDYRKDRDYKKVTKYILKELAK